MQMRLALGVGREYASLRIVLHNIYKQGKIEVLVDSQSEDCNYELIEGESIVLDDTTLLKVLKVCKKTALIELKTIPSEQARVLRQKLEDARLENKELHKLFKTAEAILLRHPKLMKEFRKIRCKQVKKQNKKEKKKSKPKK